MLLWMCPLNTCNEIWVFTPVMQQSVSNNMFKNHHVRISQLCVGNIRTQETKEQWYSVGSFLFHSSSLETSVCVYSQSMTSSFQSQTAPSDSIPAEELTEAVAEVNLEHTCDYVGLCYPAVSTSCLIYGPHLAAVHHVSSLTYRISGEWRQLKSPASLSTLQIFIKVCVSRYPYVSVCVCFNLHRVELNAITCANYFPHLRFPELLSSCLIMLLCWANDSPLNTVEGNINTTSETHSYVQRIRTTCAYMLFPPGLSVFIYLVTA